jgi:protein TonB
MKNLIALFSCLSLSLSLLNAQTENKTKKENTIKSDTAVKKFSPPTIVSVDVAEEVPNDNAEPIFVIVEDNAQFNKGDIQDFRTWVNNNLKYPEAALKEKIEGKVIVQFVVDKTGKVGYVKVLRSLEESLDKEAIRVIKSSPLWTPAKQGGKVVNQQFLIPVLFKLPESK